MESIVNIKLKNYKLIAREAVLKVIGEKYRDAANAKMDKILFIEHTDIEGLNNYVDCLKDAKAKELFLKFFKTIGIDVERFKNIDSNSPYYSEFIDLVELFFGFRAAFELKKNKFGIESFGKDCYYADLTRDAQISFLNGYLFKDEGIINKDNYEEFKNTTVYKKTEESILKWLDIFNELKNDYNAFLEELNVTIDYIKNVEDIIAKEKQHATLRIYINNKSDFPAGVLKYLENNFKTAEERAKVLGDLDDKFFGFSIFSPEYDEILKSGDKKARERVIRKRLEYFYSVGYISADFYDLSTDLNSLYESVMKRDDIALYLPSLELINNLATIKESVIYKIKLDFLLEHDEKFLNSLKEAGIIYDKDYIAKNIINKDVCQIIPVYIIERGPFVAFFFSLKKEICGIVDYVYIHEFIHILHVLFCDKQSILGLDSDDTPNPYDSNFRLYERFNETLVDLVACDALKVLHNDFCVMMFEDEYMLLSPIDRNTSSIVKNILYPFYKKYFDLIVEASMTANIDLLKDNLGEKNLSELVDLVNYIDKLARKDDLYSDIKNSNYDSPVYQDYLSKLEKVIDVYENMETYRSSKKRTL